MVIAFSAFFFVVCSLYVAYMVVTYLFIQRWPRRQTLQQVQSVAYISIVIPALNEAAVLRKTVTSLIKNATRELPDLLLELLLINDGSDDHSAVVMAELCREFPGRVYVLNRQPPHCREGKAEALNAGLAHLKKLFPERNMASWVIGVYDADSSECEEQLFKSVRTLFEGGADAVQCAVRIQNYRHLLTALQDLEFLGFSLVMQVVRDWLSGAVALGGNAQFVTMAMLQKVRTAYGNCWKPQALTEDLVLSMRIHELGGRIRFCTKAVYQEGVETLRALRHQRERWAWGTLQAWVWHAPHIFNRRYDIPFGRRLEMGYYLSFWVVPVMVVISWLLYGLGSLGFLHVDNSFPWWLLAINSFSFVPLVVIGMRAGGWSWPGAIVLGLISTVYSWHWLYPVAYGIVKVLTGSSPKWAKTARVAAVVKVRHKA